jgi:glycine betaine/proline transport system substrate-binding protein
MNTAKKLLAVLLLVPLIYACSSKEEVSACGGKVTISDMNWASASFIANVDALILKEGFGCDVELIPGATVTTFASMNEKGEPGLAPELWANAVREPLAKAVAEERLSIVNDAPIEGAGEGWWIPKYIADEHPELKTLQDILERPDLFPHPENPDKGGLVTCPSGWGCQLATNNLFRAFDMEEKGWELVATGSAAGLDGSLANAYQRGKGWLGYYWAPTSLLAKYEMVSVDFGVPYDAEGWDSCIVLSEQECVDPQPSSWTKSEVTTVTTDEFMEKIGPDAVAYFEKRSFPASNLNTMINYMSENQATGEDAAYEFLETQADLWKQWVPESIAKKIEAAL